MWFWRGRNQNAEAVESLTYSHESTTLSAALEYFRQPRKNFDRLKGSMPSSFEEIEEHLRLAEGFIATAVVPADATECEVRNALSRAYYALMHACQAWLAMRNVPENRRRTHGEIQGEIGKQRGEDFKSRLQDAYRLREDADYRPQMFNSRPYFGDVAKFRAVVSSRIANARSEFDSYVTEVRQFLLGKSPL